jgi:hypothetical protein
MSSASREQTRHDIALLLQLLRQTPSADPGWPSVARWDWRGFAKACDYHDVAPFIYCRLKAFASGSVPPGLLEHLRARFIEVSSRNFHLARKLVELSSLLEEHETPVLAYKGPTLAMVAYGDLALRAYSDLDVVVQPEHLLKALGLMTEFGFEVTPDYWNPCRSENPKYVAQFHEIALRSPDKSYFVDLHWQLAAHEARAFRLDIDKVFGRAERIDLLHARVSTLCREDLFLALCCHGTTHGWVRLRWLLDISELLRNAETMDWSRIEEMSRDRPLVRAAASLAISLSKELLEIDVPDQAARILQATDRDRKLTAAFRNDLMLRGHTSKSVNTVLLRLKGSSEAWVRAWVVQFAWLFHQVFVQVSPKERTLVHLPERLQFLYHFVRPVRLVLKHSTRAARTLWSMAR